MNHHICQDAFLGISGMKELYEKLGLIPTSEKADIVLIRSHIAYWSGAKEANRVTIKPSRGHSYKVTGCYCDNKVVRISNRYDHREGVVGWN